MTLAHLGAEAYRLQLLRGLEHQLALCGHEAVAGVDEVGRGSLAGPVVAAAVVPSDSTLLPGIDDSKRLSARHREWLAERIRSTARAWAVVPVSPAVIDRTNILRATRRAMMEAVESLRPVPDCVVVDAVELSGLSVPSYPVVRGDGLSYAVACASIVAKVERDRMMLDLDKNYPQYGFAAHKGYGAQSHLAALREYGPCPEHRLTFRSVLPGSDAADKAGAAGTATANGS